jgi:hypothetical protein
MLRPQFSLKTLLWLMVVVAAFLADAAWQHHALVDWARDVEAVNEGLLETARQYQRLAENLQTQAARSNAALEREIDHAKELRKGFAETHGFSTEPAEVEAIRERGQRGMYQVELDQPILDTASGTQE